MSSPNSNQVDGDDLDPKTDGNQDALMADVDPLGNAPVISDDLQLSNKVTQGAAARTHSSEEPGDMDRTENALESMDFVDNVKDEAMCLDVQLENSFEAVDSVDGVKSSNDQVENALESVNSNDKPNDQAMASDELPDATRGDTSNGVFRDSLGPNTQNEDLSDENKHVDNLLSAYFKDDDKPAPPESFQDFVGMEIDTPGEDNAANADEDDADAEENFKKAERVYKRKCYARKNTDLDDINFIKLQKEEHKRRAMARETQEQLEGSAEEDDNLFVPIVPINDKPFVSINESDDDEKTRPPKKRKASRTPDAKPKNPKAGKKGQPKKQQGQKPTRITKAKNQRQGNLANMSSLMGGNVFASAHANRARSEQPTFQSRNKAEAMKELIASIPEEHQSTARTDKNQLCQASRKFGRSMCQAQDGKWFIKGMKSLLEHYQMLGASFMREREALDNDEPINVPAGGLNCDEMGLGKTVMAIAVIASDRYPRSKSVSGNWGMPTLIVCPSSLLHQWRDELYKHAEHHVIGPIMMFTAASDKDDVTALKQQGVVLTTYSQVAKSYPKKEPPVELVTAAEKEDWWQSYFIARRGILHSVHWRRVILDEATAIKNFRSQTSAACSELNATFRWALSGTPAMNSLEEFYAYFRFLRVQNAGSFKLFKTNFVNGNNGKERMIAILRPFMLRRTQGDVMFGAKLLNLPKPEKDTFPVTLDDLHYEVYRIVKERFVQTINVISRKGELKAGNVLTLLLRLRQFVGHPLLIQDCIRDLLEDSDFEKIQAICSERQRRKDHGNQQQRIIQHMRRMLINRKELTQLDSLSEAGTPFMRGATFTAKTNSQQEGDISAGQTEEGIVASDDATTPENAEKKTHPADDETDKKGKAKTRGEAQQAVGASFGLKDDFFQFIDKLRKEGKNREIGERITCGRCDKVPKNPVLTDCQHTYCNDCLVQESQEHAERDEMMNACKRCNHRYTILVHYDPQDLERSKYTAPQGPLMDHNKNHNIKKEKTEDIIAQWIDKDGLMLPSGKTQAFKAQVLNWLSEDPKIKIIVYTQFVSMMKILARVCTIEKWPFLLYHGALSPAARNHQVRRFAQEPISILFATLSTGGVGLNLTMATRVLMVDPWWNSAVEQQAFCRTYRRGQDKATSMIRFAAKGTVDEHILRLQERKDTEILSVMGKEGFSKPLPMETLMRLFGEVEEDENGNPFILPEGRGKRGPAMVRDRDDIEEGIMGTEQ